MTTKVVGILLAAGKSSRFGSNKCLALLPNRTAMGIQSANKLAAAVDEIICVIPPNNQALDRLFTESELKTVVCETADQGMSQSIKAGVQYFHLDTDVTAYVIALADMPLIEEKTYQSIVAQLREGASILLPIFEGKRGNPVGFNAKFNAELTTLQGDQGAKVLFQKYAKDITLLNVDDLGIHQDFDTRTLFEQHFNEQSA